MPAWSTVIAEEFVRLARASGSALGQIELQKLTYIAHGWNLATSGTPLTGDRPEAWEFGPVYRRLADALSPFGLDPINLPIAEGLETADLDDYQTDLDHSELDVISRIYHAYGRFSRSQLSNLTRRGDTPWKEVYDGGAGKFREIPHSLIRAQFVQIATEQSRTSPLSFNANC